MDTELTYTCVPGYKRIDGFQGAQCFFFNGTARWFGPDLTCHPIDCKRPEEILNGKTIGECTTYRCQVRYIHFKKTIFRPCLLFSYIRDTMTTCYFVYGILSIWRLCNVTTLLLMAQKGNWNFYFMTIHGFYFIKQKLYSGFIVKR